MDFNPRIYIYSVSFLNKRFIDFLQILFKS